MQEIYIKASYKTIVFCHTTVLNQLQMCSTRCLWVFAQGEALWPRCQLRISWSPGRFDTPSWHFLAGQSALGTSSLSPGCCLIKGLHGQEKWGWAHTQNPGLQSQHLPGGEGPSDMQSDSRASPGLVWRDSAHSSREKPASAITSWKWKKLLEAGQY